MRLGLFLLSGLIVSLSLVSCCGQLTPLQKTVMGGDLAGTERLLREGASVDARAGSFCLAPRAATPLMLAAQKGDTSVARALLDAGADVNLHFFLGENLPPLCYAIAEGHTEMAGLLLQRGAEIRTRCIIYRGYLGTYLPGYTYKRRRRSTYSYITPFCLAVAHDAKDAVDLLLSAGLTSMEAGPELCDYAAHPRG